MQNLWHGAKEYLKEIYHLTVLLIVNKRDWWYNIHHKKLGGKITWKNKEGKWEELIKTKAEDAEIAFSTQMQDLRHPISGGFLPFFIQVPFGPSQ